MKTIYKYKVEISEHFVIDMPADAEILTVQQDQKDGYPYLWALVDTRQEECLSRIFSVFGTGNPIEDHEGVELSYIGTFQMGNGRFIGHLFELES